MQVPQRGRVPRLKRFLKKIRALLEGIRDAEAASNLLESTLWDHFFTGEVMSGNQMLKWFT